MKDDVRPVHNRLSEMRRRAGLTQHELADRLGVTQQTVWYYENGRRDIKSSMLLAMSEALDCTASELLGCEQPNPQSHDLQEDEKTLLGLYRSLSDDGKEALLACARGIESSFSGKREEENETIQDCGC